jgi:hypothetical protein
MAELTRAQRLQMLNDYDPALHRADLGGLIAEHDAHLAANDTELALQDTDVATRTKTVLIEATNAVALGLTDVTTVIAILAITTATGAAATKLLLDITTDYTVAAGDVTPVGDHSAETWVIHYV